MLVVLEGATQVCEAPHSWEGGQPPHVPPQPSSPQVLPVHVAVQLEAPPSDIPLEEELVDPLPDEKLGNPLPDEKLVNPLPDDPDDVLPKVVPLEVAAPDDDAPVPPSPGPPLEEPVFCPLDVPPELAPVPLDSLELPPSVFSADGWLDVDEQPTVPNQAADVTASINLRMGVTSGTKYGAEPAGAPGLLIPTKRIARLVPNK
jgi:hypothetical protein